MNDDLPAPSLSTPVLVPRWKGSQSLELVYRFNQRCMGLVAAAEVSAAFAQSPAISANRAMWERLRADAIERAARLPFVIVDIRFADDRWWSSVTDDVREIQLSQRRHSVGTLSGERLARETLMFAWQAARWDRFAAQLSFGMLPSVVETIAALTPAQIDELSYRQCEELCLRWAEDAAFWRDLLSACEGGDSDRIAELHLHAKLRLFGGILDIEDVSA